MRHAAFVALSFLLLSSCFGRPVWVDDRPVVQPSIGSVRPAAATHMRSASPQICREVGRSSCDVVNCKGKQLDLVTLQCSSGKITRCEIGKGRCS